MKKFISILLALFLICSFSVPAFADIENIEKVFDLNYNIGVITLVGNSSLKMYEPQDIVNDDSIIIKAVNAEPEISEVKLIIEGHVNWNNTTVTNEYNFINYTNEACTIAGKGQYWKLDVKSEVAAVGQFLTAIYDTIYSIKIETTGKFTTRSSDIYYNWGNITTRTDDFQNFDIVKDFTYNTKIGSYIKQLITGLRTFEFKNKYIVNDYPFLPTTDLDNDGIAMRNEIVKLSYSELGKGNGIEGFENLTDQIVDFFNKKTNGKIIFKVTTSPAVEVGAWLDGGIASTQNGLLSFDRRVAIHDVVGLFFNYNSTGSLVASSTVNNDGTIVFDITNVLDALGYTTHNITNVYYGLVGGINYNDKFGKGYKVESITLSYSYENEEEIEIEEEEEDTTIQIEEVEKEDEEIPDEIESVESTTTITEPVVEDVIINTTETTEPVVILDEETTIPNTTIEINDADENPRTGVSLCLIPFCIISLSSIILLKKK